MKLCNTVDRIAAYDSQTGHMNLSVVDDCHLANFLLITRVLLSYLDQEAAVDLLYDLIDTRKKSGEQVNRPFLECLCHDGVVGVCAGLCGDLPCLIPAKAFHVHEDSHQLRNGYGRVSIVQLEGNLLIQLCDIIVMFFIFCNCSLYACRNEEILLFQTQLFSFVMVVVRIQNLYDGFCKVFLLNRFVVITFVEGIQGEVLNSLCIPDGQRVYNIVVVSYDWHIVRNCVYRLIIFLYEVYASGSLIILLCYVSAKFYFFCVFRAFQLEWIAVFQPVVRYFYLITVADLLFEHTVFITDTAAVCRISQCSQGIQEACCQTAKTAVSKRRISLLVLQKVQVQFHLIKSFLYLFVCSQVNQVISQRTSHQELHGHIVQNLRILLIHCFLGFQPVVNNNVFYCVADCLVNFLLGSLFQIFSVQHFYVFFDTVLKNFFVELGV